MKRKYFGTDGIRGKVGAAPITPDFVMKLGYAAGQVLARNRTRGARPVVLIGKDTRVSGYMLESALEAGLAAAGVDVLLVGPLPTPAIAHLTCTLKLSAGIVISASHNPYDDNGIKFFSGDGFKLPDAIEIAIERGLERPLRCAPPARIGKARRVDDAVERYVEFCKQVFSGRSGLRGIRLVVDCAHGAAYHVAPRVFRELGADVIAIGDKPDGFNINLKCGATHPQALQRAVRRARADVGIAFDGDGDRLIMADGDGHIYDGDQLLYVIAAHRKRRGRLKGGVVGTQMTNLGMEHALAELKIPFVRAKVGDRYVLESLLKRGWRLGGENSGHIVCLDRHTTGDGIVSALQVLGALRADRTTLAEAAAPVTLYPQVLINVRTARHFDFDADQRVKQVVGAAKAALNGSGRILLRNSGTEPLVRVMVEGKPRTTIEHWAKTIADTVRHAAR